MRRLTLSLICALLGFLPPATAAAADRATTAKRLSSQAKKLGAYSSVTVFDTSDGSTLFEKNPAKKLAPASNEKLFVTAAALMRFGADGTLITRAVAEPGVTIDGGVLAGDLYLVGGGDPLLGDRALAALARNLASAGLERIDGRVIGDESAFDGRRGGPDSGYAYDGDLGGALSGLAWGHGSVSKGSPSLLAARRLARALKKAGIRYKLAPRSGSLPKTETEPSGATRLQAAQPDVDTAPDGAQKVPGELARVESPPMRDIIAAVNVPSENFYAEMLAKALGHRFGSGGTTASGLNVVSEALAPFGVAPRLVDGSGLTRRNRASSAQLSALLRHMRETGDADAWRASLPVAGLSGTLRKRMRGTAAAGRCRAKTGTLIGVSALSGYCVTRSGREIVFSFVENRVCSFCAKSIEDRMAATIARLD